MSVVDVTKMWSKNGGSLSSAKLSAIDQVWSNTEGYQVLTTIGTQEDAVVAAAGIPRIGDQHSTGIASYCASVDPQQVSPIFWVVTVSYRGVVSDSIYSLEWSNSTTTEPIDREWSGRAIVTANNEPVEGLSREVSDRVAIINRKFLTFDTYTVDQYLEATNSDTYLGWPPGTARLVSMPAKNVFYNNGAQELWDVTARIHFRRPYANTTPAQAWYKRWRHEGLLVRATPGAVPKRAQDGFGQEVTKPVLLKADGTQETDPDNAIFNHSQVYGSLPYSGLGLL